MTQKARLPASGVFFVVVFHLRSEIEISGHVRGLRGKQVLVFSGKSRMVCVGVRLLGQA